MHNSYEIASVVLLFIGGIEIVLSFWSFKEAKKARESAEEEILRNWEYPGIPRPYTYEQRRSLVRVVEFIRMSASSKEARDGTRTRKTATKSFFRAARAWDLIGYLLSPKTRRDCYEPAVEDLKADYLKAWAKHTSPWARRWVWFCLAFRTAKALLECTRMDLIGSVAALIPQALRTAWKAVVSKLH